MKIQISEGAWDEEEAVIGIFNLDTWLDDNADALEGEREELLAALNATGEYRVLGGVGTWHMIRTVGRAA